MILNYCYCYFGQRIYPLKLNYQRFCYIACANSSWISFWIILIAEINCSLLKLSPYIDSRSWFKTINGLLNKPLSSKLSIKILLLIFPALLDLDRLVVHVIIGVPTECWVNKVGVDHRDYINYRPNYDMTRYYLIGNLQLGKYRFFCWIFGILIIIIGIYWLLFIFEQDIFSNSIFKRCSNMNNGVWSRDNNCRCLGLVASRNSCNWRLWDII